MFTGGPRGERDVGKGDGKYGFDLTGGPRLSGVADVSNLDKIKVLLEVELRRAGVERLDSAEAALFVAAVHARAVGDASAVADQVAVSITRLMDNLPQVPTRSRRERGRRRELWRRR